MSQSPLEPSPLVPISDSQVATLRRLREISHLLDNAIRIPGTSIRIGLDPILGLLPGGGDFVGMMFSAYVVVTAAQMGVPRETLTRMVSNIILDTIAGAIPVVGDVFDVAWKANTKNIQLLHDHVGSANATKTAVDWRFMAVLMGGLFLVMLFVISLSVVLVRALIGLVTGS